MPEDSNALSQNRVRRIANPLSQRTTYTYGAAGAPNATAGRVATIQYSGPANSGIQFTETYGYVAAGGVASKALGIQGPLSTTLTGTWAYDSEGRVTTVTYPAISNTNSNPVAAYTYAFDSMGRLNTMTDQNNATLVSGVSYNAANQILSIAGTLSETRTYNANLQLIELVSGSYHYKYNYSANQNNGRITSMNDVVSGETITYQYDMLNRLISASGTGDPQGSWSQAFTFDGFGNLTQKSASNAPALSVAIDATTNRLTTNGAGYDANGNLTAYGTGVFAATYSYDVENRLNSAAVSGATYGYGYDSLNERVFSGTVNGSTYTNELIYFYGADGKKLGVWSYSASAIQNISVNQWLAGRLLKGEDRLQSVGKYFPYGEERNSPSPPNPANDQEKFATYTRDSATGLDYAVNRYYNSVIGRFMTKDPYGGSADPKYPQTQNRYAYSSNDPANGFDPTGKIILPPGYCGIDWFGDLSIFGCYDPCSADGMDSFAPTGNPEPNPGCYTPLINIPRPSLSILCNISLLTQTIKPAGYNLIVQHTSVEVDFSISGQRITSHIDGIPVNGYLTAHIGAQAYYQFTAASTVWSTGYSEAECPMAAEVVRSAISFPPKKFPYGILVQNSNSLTHALLVTKENILPWYVNLRELANPLVYGWWWPLSW